MSNFHCSEIGFISPTETLQSLGLQRFIRMRYDDLNPHFLFYKLALLILFDRNNNCFSEVSLTFWGGLAQWVETCFICQRYVLSTLLKVLVSYCILSIYLALMRPHFFRLTEMTDIRFVSLLP